MSAYKQTSVNCEKSQTLPTPVLVASFLLAFFLGSIFGVIFFRYSFPGFVIQSEQIKKCESLGGEYSIYKSFSSDAYVESCKAKRTDIAL